MHIFIKFLVKSIMEKKFRSFLILFAVTISTALFFASTAISTTMEKMFVDRLRQYIGEAEIIIHPSRDSSSPYMYMQHAKKYEDAFEYMIGTVQGQGEHKTNKDQRVQFNIQGIAYEDLQKINPLSLAGERGLFPFEGKKIIISKNTAEKYGLQLGGFLELEIGQHKKKFLIVGISNPQGFFLEDGQTTSAVVPLDTLTKLNSARGKVNQILIKLRSPQEIGSVIEMLSKEYPNYTVRPSFSKEEIESYTSEITTTFNMMLLVVLFMSIFIINTSFKVVAMERIPMIGTFRSVGATRKTTNMVLLLESLLYGCIGGIIGCVLGIGILYIMAMYTQPVWMSGFETTVSFKAHQLILAFVIAVLLSVGSSIMPVLKVTKIPIKDIVLNNIQVKRKKSKKTIYLGISFLLIIFSTPAYIPTGLRMIIYSLYLILSIISVLFLIPVCSEILMKALESLYIYLFDNIGVLAVKNIRENKSIQNNISLITIGISSLFMITTLSSSLFEELGSFYTNNAKYQVAMWAEQSDRALIQRVRTTKGVKDVFGIIEASGIEVQGKNKRIQALHGIRTGYFDFLKFNIEGNDAEIIAQLEMDRNIILAKTIKDSLGVEVGESITLAMPKGNRQYKVIGVTSALYNGGSYGMIAEKYVKQDTGNAYYGQIMVKTDEYAQIVKENLRNKFGKRLYYIEAVSEWERMDKAANNQRFAMLNGFSVMALIIGIIGVFNNFIISFLERKRSIAIYRSVGMEKRQALSMFFIESLTGGLIGGIMGVVGGFLQLYLVPYILIAVGAPGFPLHYSLQKTLLYIMGGILITILAAIGPSFKSSKWNIIEAIKYE